MITQLVARVFATRNAVHLAHWKTKSYAEHMALGDFYDELIDRIDDVVEKYQGAFDLIGDVKLKDASVSNIARHLSDEAEWIESNMTELSGGSAAVENLLQDLAGVYFKTVYKLRNLS